MTCNVCNKSNLIGVACSAFGAVSWSFCAECLQKPAEPECTFQYLYEDVGDHGRGLAPLVSLYYTWRDDKYISWPEYVRERWQQEGIEMRSFAIFMGDEFSNNEWVVHGGLEMYVRKTPGNGEFRARYGDFQIANVRALDPGKGHFGLFLDILIAQGKSVYVENVLSPRFGDYLKRRGFAIVENTDPPCYLFYNPA